MDEKFLIDPPLNALGFVFEEVSATRVTGRLTVNDKCCQTFKVLHGGVSALIAEALTGIGAAIACNYTRAAGLQLSIQHLRPALLGDSLYAECFPVSSGKTVQVWEMRLWKTKKNEDPDKKIMISTSRITFLCNLPIPEHVKYVPEQVKKFVAKL